MIARRPLTAIVILVGVLCFAGGVLLPAIQAPVARGVIGLCIITGATLVLAMTFHIGDRRLYRRLANRRELSDEELLREFVQKTGVDGASVTELLKDIAAAYRVPTGCLRPEDRFDNELVVEKGFPLDDGWDELFLRAKRNPNFPGVETMSNVRSVGDYVRLLSSSGSLTAQDKG